MATALVALATTTLASNATTVTFSSISGAYRDLRLVVTGSYSVIDTAFTVIFNSDTNTANYSNVFMNGNGSSAASFTSTTSHIESGWYTYPNSGSGMSVLDIMDYSATDKHKTVLTRADAAAGNTRAGAARWASTSAITNLQVKMPAYLSPVLNAGTVLSLYGVLS